MPYSVGFFAIGALGTMGLQAAGTLPYASPILAMQTQLKDIVKLASSTVELVQQHVTNRESNFVLARKMCEAIQAVVVNLMGLEQDDETSSRCEHAVFVLRELHGHFESLFTRFGVSRFITSSSDNKENTRLCEELDLIVRKDCLSPSESKSDLVPLTETIERMRRAVESFSDSLQNWVLASGVS